MAQMNPLIGTLNSLASSFDLTKLEIDIAPRRSAYRPVGSHTENFAERLSMMDL
jgi:hypothetical protein